MSIMVDAEFKALIPPLSPEEYSQLEENCVREGIRDPLVVWATPHGTQILVDGHNRWKIAAEHGGMHFNVIEKHFENRADAEAWIIKNQLGRRNITKFVRSELVLKLKPIIAEQAKENQRLGGKGSQKSANHKTDTREELAKIANVSHDTIHKVETVIEHGTPEIQARARSGEISTNEAYRQTMNIVRPIKKDNIVQRAREEHEAYTQQKDEKVISLQKASVDADNRRILALEVSRNISKAFDAIINITPSGQEEVGEILKSLTDEERDNNLRILANGISLLSALEEKLGG